MRPWLGFTLALGCHTAPTVHSLPHAVAPTPFDRAELAVRERGEIVLYTLAGDHVTRLAATPAGDPNGFAAFGWADHDHLFTAVDRKVVMITATGTTPVAVPDEGTLIAPQPTEGDQVAGDELGLALAPGEAWWSRCAWGYPNDGFQCTTYVYARIWPPPTSPVETTPTIPAFGALWREAEPPDLRARIAKDGKSVACTPTHGSPVVLHSDGDKDTAMEAHWVSATPPRLLVIYGAAGYSDVIPVRWALHAGCTSEPLERGDSTLLGPRGLWVSTERLHEAHQRVRVWRGATVLGELPSADVRFRP